MGDMYKIVWELTDEDGNTKYETNINPLSNIGNVQRGLNELHPDFKADILVMEKVN